MEEDFRIISVRNWIQKWQDWDELRMVTEEARVRDGLLCQ